MKVLSIVMGIIYLILGILCFITPVFTANVFTYIIAASILLAGDMDDCFIFRKPG